MAILQDLNHGWYITQPVDLTNLHYTINNQPISNQKMTSVGLEPQWCITQHIVFITTRPLGRCLKP
jgi:hypothetical protein